MLKSCWIHSKDYAFLSYCSTWWNELWSETYITVQNPEPVNFRCFVRFANFTEIHLRQSLCDNKVASEFWQIFMSNFLDRTVTDDCVWKWKTFFLSKFILLIFDKLFFQTLNLQNGRNDTNVGTAFSKKFVQLFLKK